MDMKENQLIEQLKYYYEIDLNNCNMTNQEWIKELAKCMADPDSYRIQFFNELIEYKQERES